MKLLVSFISLLFILSSCVKNNPDPSWIEVTKWTLQTNPNAAVSPGELTENLTDACVFIDDQSMGIFEVPFKIPILKSGSVNIKIYPVVKNNGISATKKIYPFLKVFQLNTELIQNQTLTLNPVTSYNDNTQFWIEDFEDAAIKVIDDANSQAHILSGNDPSVLKYGNFYGHVALNSTDSVWLAMTNGQLNLPKGGHEVYLEIDYYNTNSVTTGTVAFSSSSVKGNPNITLNKQDISTIKWKKIYIDLKEVISFSTTAQYFEISFEALYNAGLPQGDIYLDNIKVVY